MRQSLLACSLVVLFLATACAPKSLPPQIDASASKEEQQLQMKLAAKHRVDRQKRLQTISYRLNDANTDLCDEDHLAPRYGFFTMSLESYDDDWQEAYFALFGEKRHPVVYAVPEVGPAYEAGLREGDEVLAVNGEEIEPGSKCNRELGELLEDAAEDHKPVTLTVKGETGIRTVSIRPRTSCTYPSLLAPGNEVNAYTDGEKIYIYNGLMKFCDSDDELAVVVGHEMAHAVMEHIDSKRANMVVGSIFDALILVATGVNTQVGQQIGAQAYSQEYEQEADYVGMYIIAKAGYEYDDVSSFWRRMAVEHPNSITHASTHPRTADRFLALEATETELNQRKALKQPLEFDMKDED